MDPAYEAEEARILARLAESGLLYRGKKPVFWCFQLRTALAFSEAVYRERKSPSICAQFHLRPEALKKLRLKLPASAVIWTTTPWTLPANSAIALHPDFSYGFYEAPGGSRLWLIAGGRRAAFMKETGLALPQKAKKTFKGRELEGLSAAHPFIERDSPFVLGDHVTLESGTGCVHTAPGHGLDDYALGAKYKLPMPCPVDERGHFTEEAPEDLKGVFIFKGNRIIQSRLRASGHLLAEKEITHSYPHSERSGSPLIYRLTPQWFLAMDRPAGKKGQSLRGQALAACRQIRFSPPESRARLEAMLKNSPDWCLSRQRLWGVPLPVFYCGACGEALLSPEIIRAIADKMEESGEGIEYYFSRPAAELLPAGQKCGACGGGKFRKGEDILDVWLDSGVQHAVFRKKGLPFPADLFLEGSDQHRGWFQTSLVSALALTGQAPFKALFTHGFVNDKEGRKMSKSKGNALDPEAIAQSRGAEILRLWAAGENAALDPRAGGEQLQRAEEGYRRFRNTFRFLLGNLSGFDPERDIQPFQRLDASDRWILIRLNRLAARAAEDFEALALHRLCQRLSRFFASDLSAFYLDIIKGRLYTFGRRSPERLRAQTALFYLLQTLPPLMAPITSFLAEEAYSHAPCGSGPGGCPAEKKESVFLEDFPKGNPKWRDSALERLFERLFALRGELNSRLEAVRRAGGIGSPLQAAARLSLPKGFLDPPLSHRELREFFSVSHVEVSASPRPGIEARKAPGEKCLRCWLFSPALNQEKVCPQCQKSMALDRAAGNFKDSPLS